MTARAEIDPGVAVSKVGKQDGACSSLQMFEYDMSLTQTNAAEAK